MSPSSGGLVVLVDEAAEAVTALDRAAGRGLAAAPRLRRTQVERAVRPLAVVVLDVRAEDVLEVAAVEDQQQVQTLGTHGADEPLRDRVCLRRPHGSLHGPDAFAAEDFVEGFGVPKRCSQRGIVPICGGTECWRPTQMTPKNQEVGRRVALPGPRRADVTMKSDRRALCTTVSGGFREGKARRGCSRMSGERLGRRGLPGGVLHECATAE